MGRARALRWTVGGEAEGWGGDGGEAAFRNFYPAPPCYARIAPSMGKGRGAAGSWVRGSGAPAPAAGLRRSGTEARERRGSRRGRRVPTTRHRGESLTANSLFGEPTPDPDPTRHLQRASRRSTLGPRPNLLQLLTVNLFWRTRTRSGVQPPPPLSAVPAPAPSFAKPTPARTYPPGGGIHGSRLTSGYICEPSRTHTHNPSYGGRAKDARGGETERRGGGEGRDSHAPSPPSPTFPRPILR